MLTRIDALAGQQISNDYASRGIKDPARGAEAAA